MLSYLMCLRALAAFRMSGTSTATAASCSSLMQRRGVWLSCCVQGLSSVCVDKRLSEPATHLQMTMCGGMVSQSTAMVDTRLF